MFTLSTTCSKPKGSSSGRRLYLPVWYNYTGTYSRLPEDEPLGLEHVVDNVKIEILV